MAESEKGLSKSQVNKAGRTIRKRISGEEIPIERFLEAAGVPRAAP